MLPAISRPYDPRTRLHVTPDLVWLAAPDSPADPAVSPRIADVLEPLGAGAHGTVLKARLVHSGAVVAIKRIPLLPAADRSPIDREVRLLRACKHPNLLPYYGAFVDAGCIMIITELCAAGSLADALKLTPDPFDDAEIAFVLWSALEGLAYLHERNIVHRDLKAANLLLTDTGVVKLADFGVAEKLSPAGAASGSLAGSPYWMSPEVITGLAYGPPADIWSLGITAIELAQGVPPLFHLHPVQAMAQIPFAPPPALDRPDARSTGLSALIAVCVAKDPLVRPAARALLVHPFLLRAKLASPRRSPLAARVERVLVARRSPPADNLASAAAASAAAVSPSRHTFAPSLARPASLGLDLMHAHVRDRSPVHHQQTAASQQHLQPFQAHQQQYQYQTHQQQHPLLSQHPLPQHQMHHHQPHQAMPQSHGRTWRRHSEGTATSSTYSSTASAAAAAAAAASASMSSLLGPSMAGGTVDSHHSASPARRSKLPRESIGAGMHMIADAFRALRNPASALDQALHAQGLIPTPPLLFDDQADTIVDESASSLVGLLAVPPAALELGRLVPRGDASPLAGFGAMPMALPSARGATFSSDTTLATDLASSVGAGAGATASAAGKPRGHAAMAAGAAGAALLARSVSPPPPPLLLLSPEPVRPSSRQTLLDTQDDDDDGGGGGGDLFGFDCHQRSGGLPMPLVPLAPSSSDSTELVDAGRSGDAGGWRRHAFDGDGGGDGDGDGEGDADGDRDDDACTTPPLQIRGFERRVQHARNRSVDRHGGDGRVLLGVHPSSLPDASVLGRGVPARRGEGGIHARGVGTRLARRNAVAAAATAAAATTAGAAASAGMKDGAQEGGPVVDRGRARAGMGHQRAASMPAGLVLTSPPPASVVRMRRRGVVRDALPAAPPVAMAVAVTSAGGDPAAPFAAPAAALADAPAAPETNPSSARPVARSASSSLVRVVLLMLVGPHNATADALRARLLATHAVYLAVIAVLLAGLFAA
ncbi:hypothetical protein HK105_206298 [Polyrhizophydium stewartii]|uniref:non-specific serine/threonine protein kinase n=1 Tax=Polyrhizophydium stewartii TaxID=2732419 RepID=A0ABR4N3Y2_9FUNG